jgi:Tol biopolymer transport system component/tRNA A-37 threonylcarbamoyl transferase component Bud32
MTVTAGTRLGSYEIIAPLGEGGMGEVYRARDAKLNRDVAIKVLPNRLVHDPTSLARFEREAQAVAALSHPNILAIYDFGRQDNIVYAVTELLEGETLRGRLSHGSLPTRKAIDLGVHIVHGISAAHERGIVHRDLKPENIFITNDGVVKILDFGLATFSPGSDSGAKEAGSRVPGNDETRAALTGEGMVLGTVGYMSPEQVRGQAIDHRTDIFSFGAILYELLTGRRPFKGDSHVETMNAILKEDPPEFAEINPNLPGSLDRIVRRCLEKRPQDRFHSAHDLAIALEALSGASSQSSASMAVPAVPGAKPRRGISPALVIVGAAFVAAAAFAAGKLLTGTGSAASLAETEFVRLTYRRGPIWSSAIAPDGATFVYSAVWEGSPLQIYSTRQDSPESQALPYTNADITAISSKGELAIIKNRRAVTAFSRVGTLARATLTGGASRDVMENVQHADWLPDGSDFAVSRLVGSKYQLEFPIGKVVYETTGWISQVSVSPDGKLVAFQDQSVAGDDRGSISVIDAAGKKQALPVQCESTQGIAWSPSGKEVWFTCASKGLWRALLAASLDGKVRKVLQVPGSLFLGDIAADGTVLLSHDNSRRGVIGLAPGETKERDLSWLDWTQPQMLAADGKTLLISEQGEGGGPGYGVFVRPTDGSPAVRLGTGEALALSSDGKWVIAQDLGTEPVQLNLLPTGAGQARKLTSDDIAHINARFLPDGKRFLFAGFKPNQGMRVWIQSIDGGAATPVTEEGVVGLTMTPDGKRIIARGTDGVRRLHPIDPQAGQPEEIKLEAADGVLRFAADGRSIFVRRLQAGGLVQVFRLDLSSGARTLIRTITPLPESISLGGIGALQVSLDGSAFVYGYGVTHSDLFLVKGLK